MMKQKHCLQELCIKRSALLELRTGNAKEKTLASWLSFLSFSRAWFGVAGRLEKETHTHTNLGSLYISLSRIPLETVGGVRTPTSYNLFLLRRVQQSPPQDNWPAAVEIPENISSPIYFFSFERESIIITLYHRIRWIKGFTDKVAWQKTVPAPWIFW